MAARTHADFVTKIDEQLAELEGKMTALLAPLDENKPLSKEQQEEFDAHDTKFEELLAEKTEIKTGLERELKLQTRQAESAALSEYINQGNGRQSSADQLAATQTTNTRQASAENLTTYRLSSGEVTQRKKWGSLGEQLQAIAAEEMTGKSPGSGNPDLVFDLFDKPQQGLAVATGGAAAGVPSDGGYLIQKEFASELFSRMSSVGSLADPSIPQVRNVPIGPNSDGLKLTVVDETSRATGSRWGGVQVYWGAEGDAATAKKPKLRQMELELKELIGLAYATNRLLGDASALESIFLQAFSEEMAFMKEDARINGTGAGQPKGIKSATGASATLDITKETGQAAATVTYVNIVNMWSRLWGRSRANSVWILNQDVEPLLYQMTLATGTGGVPVYLPPGGANDSPYGRLMGRPVVSVEYCQTVGTSGDLILWDPTQYLEITKGGMQADQSVHVRFTTNENTFRFITRVDGQPMWNSALTPFKGSNTQSPQITLATRA